MNGDIPASSLAAMFAAMCTFVSSNCSKWVVWRFGRMYFSMVGTGRCHWEQSIGIGISEPHSSVCFFCFIFVFFLDTLSRPDSVDDLWSTKHFNDCFYLYGSISCGGRGPGIVHAGSNSGDTKALGLIKRLVL